MTVYYGQASSYIRKHHLHKNGNSWRDIKNIDRPRYPWFEVTYNDNNFSRKKYPIMNEQPQIQIMLHRKYGLNGIELFSLDQVENMISMLTSAKDLMKKEKDDDEDDTCSY